MDTFNELSPEETRSGRQVIPVDLLKVQQYQGSNALAFTTMYNIIHKPINLPYFFLSLSANDFKAKEIAKLMGVKLRTLQRRMSDHGINMRTCYSSISDQDLDQCVSSARTLFPKFGMRFT